jgi:hypothetical protein
MAACGDQRQEKSMYMDSMASAVKGKLPLYFNPCLNPSVSFGLLSAFP